MADIVCLALSRPSGTLSLRERDLTKHDLGLHECHALGHNHERNESFAQEAADVVHRFVIHLIDPQREPMDTVIANDLRLQRVDLLHEVVKLFKEGGVIHLRPNFRDGVAWKPAAFIVGVEDFEVAAFDFDDQPQLLRELKLISIVLRSAVNEVADVNGVWFGLFQCLSNVGGAHELRYRLQVDMSI